MSAWAVVVYIVGSQRGRSDLIASGDRAVHVVAVMTLAAVVVLLLGLLTHDFAMRYVATYSSVNLPRPYLAAALWSGQRGSLLVATFCLSVFAVGATLARSRSPNRIQSALLSTVLVVALSALCFGLDPLGRLDWAPVDGIGMHPALQSPAAVLFPPLLLAAYAAYAVAGTRALEGILTRSIDRGGTRSLTRWMIAAWALNSLGLVAGLWWAYRAPSRAAKWTMFPLETGALLPWLAATAFLGILLAWNGRRELPAWTLSLVAAAMLLAGPAAALTTATVAQAAATVARSGLFVFACVAVAIAIGVCAFLASHRLENAGTSLGERRVYSLALIAIASGMIAGSICGYFFRTESTAQVSVAKPAQVIDATGAKWSLISQGLSSFNALNRQVTALGLEVIRGDTPAGLLSPEIRQYLDVQGEPVFEPSRVPAVRSSLREDVHVVVREIAENDRVMLEITVSPLLSWLWIGSLLLVFGGIMATWPGNDAETPA